MSSSSSCFASLSLLALVIASASCGDSDDRVELDGAVEDDAAMPAVDWAPAGDLPWPVFVTRGFELGERVVVLGATRSALDIGTVFWDGDVWTAAEPSMAAPASGSAATQTSGGVALAGSASLFAADLRPPVGAGDPAGLLTAAGEFQPWSRLPMGVTLAEMLDTPTGPIVVGGLRPTPELTTLATSWRHEDGEWRSVGNLSESRYGHELLEVDDTPVVVGGHQIAPGTPASDAVPLASVEALEVEEWVPWAPMPTARGFFAAAVLSPDTFVVAGGMVSDTEATTAVDLWSGGEWVSAAPLPIPLAYGAFVQVGRDLLVLGGVTGWSRDGASSRVARTTNRVFRYLSAEDRWVELAPLPEPRYAHAAVRLSDGRVLVAGGIVSVDPEVPEVEYAVTARVSREPVE